MVAWCTRLEAEVKMDDNIDVGPSNDGSYCALVEWEGLGSLCDAVSKIYDGAPKVLENKLKRMELLASVKDEIRSHCVMRL